MRGAIPSRHAATVSHVTITGRYFTTSLIASTQRAEQPYEAARAILRPGPLQRPGDAGGGVREVSDKRVYARAGAEPASAGRGCSVSAADRGQGPPTSQALPAFLDLALRECK